MNADQYITGMAIFEPFLPAEFQLMKGNARPPLAAVVGNYFREVGVWTMKCPAKGPDLNSMEYLRDELKVPTRCRGVVLETLQKEEGVLLLFIQTLVRSMPAVL